MRTLEVIEASKREITERAKTVVLNVDDLRLAKWPESLRAQGKTVVTRRFGERRAPTCAWSSRLGAGPSSSTGRDLGTVDEVVGVQPTNLACALGAALALGVDARARCSRAFARLDAGREPAERRDRAVGRRGHRRHVQRQSRERVSPRSTLLRALELTGRRVVVTPGLVELGADSTWRTCDWANGWLPCRRRAGRRGPHERARARDAATRNGPRASTRATEAVAWVRATLRARRRRSLPQRPARPLPLRSDGGVAR